MKRFIVSMKPFIIAVVSLLVMASECDHTMFRIAYFDETNSGANKLAFIVDGMVVPSETNGLVYKTVGADVVDDTLKISSGLVRSPYCYICISIPLSEVQTDSPIQDFKIKLHYDSVGNGDNKDIKDAAIEDKTITLRKFDKEERVVSGNFTFRYRLPGMYEGKVLEAEYGNFDMFIFNQ